VLLSQVSCGLTPTDLQSPLRFLQWNHGRTACGNNRYVKSSQELEEQALVLGINLTVVSDLFCYCLRSVVDLPRRFSCVFTFVMAESRERGLGTSRFGVIPSTFWASSRLSRRNHERAASALVGTCARVRSQGSRFLCLLLALQW